jgi:hypothetical protein
MDKKTENTWRNIFVSVVQQQFRVKVAGVKVYLRQTWNFRAYAVSECIGLWCHGAVQGVHQGILKGMYHCTGDLLFDWFGLVCFANKNKNSQLSYSLFQNSQTGGQRYNDTSPFSIPWVHACICLWCMHWPVTSWANHMVAACTYCMGSNVSSLSRIYLYSRYFGLE